MIVPVILCGGAGARLWPLSRPDAPKPVLPLVEGRSTLAMTLERVDQSDLFAPPVIVTGAAHRGPVGAVVDVWGKPARFVLEPMGRNTAPAVAAAAALLGGDDLMMVLAADHLIRDVEGFRATVKAAAPVAEAGHIVVFGIAPTGPATGYGYIAPGAALAEGVGRKVGRFTEKPDAATTATMIADGYLWNSGMFLVRADVMTAELAAHAAEVARHAAAALPETPGDEVLLDEGAFARCPDISLDYAVMEKTDRAAVVEAAFDWSDLGTWPTVLDAGEADAAGNVLQGDVTAVDVAGSLVVSTRPRVGVLGVRGVVVVASDDAVLVTDRAGAERVKDLSKAIQAAPEKVIGDFARHYRPWGNYQALDLGATYQVKRLVVNPGKRLSLQRHRHRAEHWTVVEGRAEVTIDDQILDLGPDESAYIPRGAVHRLANRGAVPLTVIEVQNGSYLGEDDIERLEDDFGR